MIFCSGCTERGGNRPRTAQAPEMGTDHVPRFVYGQYLIERLGEAIDSLRERKISVDIVHGAATGVRISGVCVKILVGKNTWIQSRWLIYAPGYPSLANFPDFESSPFFICNPLENRTLLDIGTVDKVAMLGTGLTAVDLVMELIDNGFSGRIDCYSRNALLPTVRSYRHNAEILPHYSSFHSLRDRKARNGHLMVSDILYCLVKDLKKFPNHEGKMVNKINTQLQHAGFLKVLISCAQSSNLPLQFLLQATSTYAFKIWTLLPDNEKRKFLSRLNRIWSVWRSPIPFTTAQTIFKALSDGYLTINRLTVYKAGKTGIMLATPSHETCYRWVIDGTGGHCAVDRTRDPFLRQALRLGLLQASAYGGLSVEPETLKSINNFKLKTEIFLLGQIAKGDLFSTSNFHFNSIFTQKIAEHIIRQVS